LTFWTDRNYIIVISLEVGLPDLAFFWIFARGGSQRLNALRGGGLDVLIASVSRVGEDSFGASSFLIVSSTAGITA
jgi:hypothetical protein